MATTKKTFKSEVTDLLKKYLEKEDFTAAVGVHYVAGDDYVELDLLENKESGQTVRVRRKVK